MKKTLLLLISGLLMIIGCAASADVLLTGNYLQLPINNSDAPGCFMGSGASQGAKYNPSGTGGAAGVDFWKWGTPVYNYTIDSSIRLVNGIGWYTTPTVTNTSSGSLLSATIAGSPLAGMSFSRSVSFQANSKVITIHDMVTNSGAIPKNVATLDCADPDQGFPQNGMYETSNDVISLGGANQLVGASNVLTVGFGSPDSKRVVSAEGPFDHLFTPADIINSPVDPNGEMSDVQICIAADYGTIASGQSSSFTWYMVFGDSTSEVIDTYSDAAVPEPSSLLVLGSGGLMGLLGFIRRKR